MAGKDGFKFRVSYRVRDSGADLPRIVEFSYRTFREARQNYKAILLEFYRRRRIGEFAICLNRTGDPSWKNPIFFEEDTPA